MAENPFPNLVLGKKKIYLLVSSWVGWGSGAGALCPGVVWADVFSLVDGPLCVPKA